MNNLNKNQSGFTLLELLVVTAILAIIAGAVISAIGGKEEQAGGQVTVHTMAALESATRQHSVLEKEAPSRLESLVCADFVSGAAAISSGLASEAVFGSATDATHGLSDDLQDITQLTDFISSAVAALTAAGVEELMYVDTQYCDDVEGAGTDFGDGAEDDFEADEANSYVIFDTPDTSEGGRGFVVTLDDAGNSNLVQVNEPDEIGAREEDFIVILGIGNESGLVSNGYLARPPRDGNVSPVETYSHYSLAYRIGVDANDNGTLELGEQIDEAVLVAVVDAGGDAYNEEILEAAGLEDEDG